MKYSLLKLAVVATGLALAGVAAAEPAKVMVPGGAGGGWDTTARQVLAAMEKSGVFKDGAQYVNKGGAAGTIGLAEFVGNSKGQDNAIMVMGAIMVGGIVLNKSPVSLNEVTPLVRLTNEYNVIAVPANSPMKTMKDFAEALKKDPGAVSVGGGSAGGVDHLTLALLAKHVGAPVAKINYIPYASGADTAAALAGGKITAAISGVSEFKQLADAGRLRFLAVTSDKRLAGIAVPTLKESGIDLEIGNWRGFMGAPGMSAKGRQDWLTRFEKMHASAAWKEVLQTQGWDDAYLPGDKFAAFLKDEVARQTTALNDVGLVK
jgi:putative tricarboxylic transport membrane protein